MTGDPAVAAMYERLRQGGGIGIGGGLRSIQQGNMAPALTRHMQDAARIYGSQGQTDYNMALSPMNYGLFSNAQNANRSLDLQRRQMEQSQQNTGMQYVMQLLSPFLGSLMQQGGA